MTIIITKTKKKNKNILLVYKKKTLVMDDSAFVLENFYLLLQISGFEPLSLRTSQNSALRFFSIDA